MLRFRRKKKACDLLPNVNGQVVCPKVREDLSKHSVAFLKAALQRRSQTHREVPDGRTEVVFD